jgi:hypothetical protein
VRSDRAVLGNVFIEQDASLDIAQQPRQRILAVEEWAIAHVLSDPGCRTGSCSLVYTTGIRNSVGMDFNPKDKTLWFTDNQVDGMGDDVPPGEINRATKAGENFGFPYCGGGHTRTDEYKNETPPANVLFPQVEMVAHAADLEARQIRPSHSPKVGSTRTGSISAAQSTSRSSGTVRCWCRTICRARSIASGTTAGSGCDGRITDRPANGAASFGTRRRVLGKAEEPALLHNRLAHQWDCRCRRRDCCRCGRRQVGTPEGPSSAKPAIALTGNRRYGRRRTLPVGMLELDGERFHKSTHQRDEAAAQAVAEQGMSPADAAKPE